MEDFSTHLSDLLGQTPPDPETENAAPAGPRNGAELSEDSDLPRQDSANPAKLLEVSALDRPIQISRFADVRARSLQSESLSLRQLSDLIGRTHATEKRELPLLKLATFGNQRRDSGSLRHDGNLESVHGIEGDYDAGAVTPEEAADRLRNANVAGLIYTTPSHAPHAPRWRVLCPLAAPVSPEARDDLCARVNGALGGILASESFTRSQSYYFGAVAGAEPPEVHLVDGRAIDRATDLPRIGKGGTDWHPDLAELLGTPVENAVPVEDDDSWFQREPDWSRIKAALRSIKDASDRGAWLEIGAALHHESGGSDQGFRLWCAWSKRCPEKFKESDQRRTWQSFGNRKGELIGIGTLYHHAKAHGWNGETKPDKPDKPDKPSPLSFLSPSDCEAAPSRGYLVKGLFAPRDVACIFGAPGAGKSLLAPFLGYMVTQGTDAFGMRTKQGGVFYVAAEDPHGMRGRVKALKTAHGDAPTFHLVEGVSDLLSLESPDLAALKTAAKERRPALIFIDTLAMAFPGLEENSSEAMGRVVAVARGLTEWGAAVVLIHHDTKAEGLTPRGHSLLNGALDVALHVKRDESGVIRGKLTKNRNGPCERDIAFTIATEDGGTDEDGDTIRLPRCHELMPGAGFDVKLSASERATVAVLRELIAERCALAKMPNFADQSGVDANPSCIPESEWRERCVAPGVVSDAATRHSRVKSYNRNVKSLAGHGVILIMSRPGESDRTVQLNDYCGLEDDAQ